MGKFVWFILGLVLGAALVLVALTLMHRSERIPEPPAAPSEPLPVQRLNPPQPAALAPTPPKVRKAEPRVRPPSAADDDAQMAEDAAAAGMTSRARPREPAADAPASDTP